MTESTTPRRDDRDCPHCGARGILPLQQEPGDGAITGTIESPLMICPACDKDYRATGMTWVGAVDVGSMTDTEIEEFANVVIAQILEGARRPSREDGNA